jgi:multidrug efflux pump subunit AcrA (membrane-fusion protein)
MNVPQVIKTRYQVMAWGTVALLAIATAVGCSQADGTVATAAKTKSAAAENAPRVQTVSVQPKDLAHKIELPGTVEGYETADLYAKVGGFLAEISVDIGDHVTKGQVLARLSIPEMDKELLQKQAAIASAEADVGQSRAALHEAKTELHEKQAQLNQQLAAFERTKDLVARGSLQQKLLDEATYQRDAAQAALETVRAAIQTAEAVLAASAAKVELVQAERDRVQTLIEYGEIHAPFDGMVMKRFVDPGAFIQPADGNSSARPLVTVTRIDIVRIWLDLPMAEVRWLDRGDRVVFLRIKVLPRG